MNWMEFTTTLIVNLTGLLVVYSKLKGKVTEQGEQTRTFNDVAIQKLNGTATSIIHSFDRPAWVKRAIVNPATGDTEFRMLEINDLYGELFGFSRQHYLGKTDLEAGWSSSEAEKFYQHDLMVWATGESQTFEEMIHGKKFRFRKLRLMSRDGVLKGVMGYAVDEMPEGE